MSLFLYRFVGDDFGNCNKWNYKSKKKSKEEAVENTL
jgi:hypothetical protein